MSMSLALQGVLVGVAVAACALYSVWRLATLRFRLRVIEALGSLPPALTTPWLAALRNRTLAQLAGGCAGCSAGGAPTRDAAARPNQTPGALRR
ncbi:MAG TPA: DUF6587 family protein [Steroidobacteraceae bacterium]|nr:DUF6587 family protein [Steroidobacteraceae bacterium]